MADLESLWQRAREEMDSYGLQDWSLFYHSAKGRVLGSTQHWVRVIRLSAPHMIAMSDAESWDVVLHEIAHALAPMEAGHGPVWARIARKIGANASRVTDLGEEDFSDYKVIGECENGHKYGRTKLPQSVSYRCGKAPCRARISWRRNVVAVNPAVAAAVKAHGESASVPLSRVGEKVRLVIPGTSWDGLEGSVTSVGRVNYIVKLQGHSRSIRIPFKAVEAVKGDNSALAW